MAWKPNKAARREFAKKMQDPEFKAAYQERRILKAEINMQKSMYVYTTAGGNYLPTRQQHDAALRLAAIGNDIQKEAANEVACGYASQIKVHHDYIHIVNEFIRNQN